MPVSNRVKQLIQKNGKVKFVMAGKDGNAFSIMARFNKQAIRSDWPDEDIKAVMDEARSKDYNHLLQTMLEVKE